MDTTPRVDARLWLEPGDLGLNGESLVGESVRLEAERTEPDEVAVFVYMGGNAVSLYLSREGAVELARMLLNEARLR